MWDRIAFVVFCYLKISSSVHWLYSRSLILKVTLITLHKESVMATLTRSFYINFVLLLDKKPLLSIDGLSSRIFGGQFGGLTSQTSFSELSTISDNHQSVEHGQNTEITMYIQFVKSTDYSKLRVSFSSCQLIYVYET